MRPRKISDAMRERMVQVALARAQIPTDKQLANEAHCSVRAVQWVMRQALLRLCVVPRGTSHGIFSLSVTEARNALEVGHQLDRSGP